MELDGRLKLFVALAALFVTSLLVGDLIGGKLYQTSAAGVALTISVGMIPFPVVFLLTDLLNEFYGQRAARYVTLVGFGMAWFTIGVLWVAGLVPMAPFTTEADWAGVTGDAFQRVFSSSQWILMSSTVAYLIGQLLDIAVFHKLKEHTGGRMLWLRATGSTAISQLIDTVVINLLVWGSTLPFGDLVSVAATSYVVKLAAAIALTPLIYASHAVVERTLGIAPVGVDSQSAEVAMPELPGLAPESA